MADRTWQKAFLLAAVGVALAAGCTINSEDGDDDDGEAGSGGSSSGTGGKGGSSGTAGKGGSSGSGGSAGSGGSSGSAGKGGSAGSTGGSAGSSGTSGEGGEAGMRDTRMDPICDPESGEIQGTPYDDCEPAPGDEEEPCALCIKASCCEESKNCYAYEPGNVCGWGGPAENGEYLGGGEIGCFRTCILEAVEQDGTYTLETEDECAASCATETDSAGMACDGLVGVATSDLIGCMHENCESECFE